MWECILRWSHCKENQRMMHWNSRLWSLGLPLGERGPQGTSKVPISFLRGGGVLKRGYIYVTRIILHVWYIKVFKHIYEIVNSMNKINHLLIKFWITRKRRHLLEFVAGMAWANKMKPHWPSGLWMLSTCAGWPSLRDSHGQVKKAWGPD